MAEIFTFSPYGYEGSLVHAEADIRRGIPAVDIVGLADGRVNECRRRIRAAIGGSGLGFPEGRVLVTLSPFELMKEGESLELAAALAVISASDGGLYMRERVIVLGGLEPSGEVRGVRAVHAALTTASYAGIRHAVVPKANLPEAMAVEGLMVAGVENLMEAEAALRDGSMFQDSGRMKDDGSDVRFPADRDAEESAGTLRLSERLVRAVETAVAGRHHLLVVGKPGCGMSLAVRTLVPLVTPELTVSESRPVTRVWSIAGILRPEDSLVRAAPFRMPHPTVSIEGMCGGGSGCRPGEASLAHNGVLFLEDAAEFRSSVLQMLRVPMESGVITLSRAGRGTCYPAGFQLMMTASPCPCGNFGNRSGICLCSRESVERYWRKLGSPLIDRIGVIVRLGGDEETACVDVGEMRRRIGTAYRIQRLRGAYNGSLTERQARECGISAEAGRILDSHAAGLCERRRLSILRVAVTIANMDGRETVGGNDVVEAMSFSDTSDFTIG